MTNERTSTYSVRLPPSLHNDVKAAASARGLTLSAAFEIGLRHFLAEDDTAAAIERTYMEDLRRQIDDFENREDPTA